MGKLIFAIFWFITGAAFEYLFKIALDKRNKILEKEKINIKEK